MATRCGFVALIGVPNAGKSTLLNTLVGAKVSIVSRKVQTTRTQIRGIAIAGATQVVFVDTPGIFAAKRRLEQAMVTSAWGGATDADLVGVLIDVTRADDEAQEALFARLGEIRQPLFLVLNKIDLIPHEQLLTIADRLNRGRSFEATFMVSAARGHGVRRILEWLEDKLPPG
ncbi:MAG: GTPase Era, partial [Rhabdaerophilum calidifontis]